MELVTAVLAGQRRQAAVRGVQHAVADVALLDALHLFVDVGLPKEDGRDDVAVARLDQVTDGKGPLTHLARLELLVLAVASCSRTMYRL